MTELTLTLTGMANGGLAFGKDRRGRIVFVPQAIPGETVRVRLVDEQPRHADAELVAVVNDSAERVPPVCPHFGVCDGCHFQHIRYDAQLAHKHAVLVDQLKRVGKVTGVPVRPVIPNPDPYGSQSDFTFYATEDGLPGLWSAALQRIVPIETCHLLDSRLRDLYADLDFDLSTLRQMTLRVGADGDLLLALETEDVEPPALLTDFPVSVALVLPDGVSANLIGDNYVVKQVHGRDFRVTAGCFFHPSPAAAAALVDTVLGLAQLDGSGTVIEAYSGVGMLTAWLAQAAEQVIGIEINEDAVADAALNLAETENVALYNDWVESALLHLRETPARLVVVDPPAEGLSKAVVTALAELSARRLIYSSRDVGSLAQDARRLVRAGFKPVSVQPIDMEPQTFRLHTVSLWRR